MLEAIYFGCVRSGHGLHRNDMRSTYPDKIPGFPWTAGNLDTGLLKNGKHPDIVDGKVFWTLGGRPLWARFLLVGPLWRQA